MASQNPIDYFAIQNTLSRYCIAIDTKDFASLEQIFTEDVDANYPWNENLKGVRNVANAVQERLAPVKTHHALSTQTISISADGKSAEAVTYFTGTHFGQGKWEGKEITAWGKYVDTLTVVEGKESLPGASGQRLICRREVDLMGRLGEGRVMVGE